MMIVLAALLKRPTVPSLPVVLLERTEDQFNGKERNKKAQMMGKKYERIPKPHLRILIHASKTNKKMIRESTHMHPHTFVFSPNISSFVVNFGHEFLLTKEKATLRSQ